MSNLRAMALRGAVWGAAHDQVGIYPKAITGENGYQKRSDWMEGWNACALKHSHNFSIIMKWLKSLAPMHRETIEDLILSNALDLFVKNESVETMVNCNDLFFWGCADCENIELAEIPDLIVAIKDATEAGAPSCGGLLWVARKRKMRPQGAYYAHVSPGLGELFDRCGPFRKAELGNPVASSATDGARYREEMERDGRT